MNVSSTTPTDVFDVRKIRRLVELMKEHDLSEMDIQQGEVRIQLRRAGMAVQPTIIQAPVPQVVAAQPLAAAPAPAAPAAAEEADNFAVIKSPMVGTYYAAADPESPPFVKVGDHVGPETTVCIVEAMKVFNQIPAELSGRIVAALVENGASVEFGQPLFKVNTRQ